jgi:hypothetical protein
MKDAQGILRHASIKTTADVYVQKIPASIRAANQLPDAGHSCQRAGQWHESGRCNVSQRVPTGGSSLCKCLKRMAPQVGLEST